MKVGLFFLDLDFYYKLIAQFVSIIIIRYWLSSTNLTFINGGRERKRERKIPKYRKKIPSAHFTYSKHDSEIAIYRRFLQLWCKKRNILRVLRKLERVLIRACG